MKERIRIAFDHRTRFCCGSSIKPTSRFHSSQSSCWSRLDVQLVRRAHYIVEYRPRGRVVIVRMCRVWLVRDLDKVPELHAIVLAAVVGEVGLQVQPALDETGPAVVI
jgi:hypothetical protein